MNDLITLGELKENIFINNTFKIKCKSRYLFLPNNKESLVKALSILKKNKLKYVILGNCSNVILPDNDFDGVVIKLNNLSNINYKDNEIYVGAGVLLPALVTDSIKNNLSGLEWAAHIPGNIGGSIMGNAGAYKEEIFDYIKSIEVIDNDFNIFTIEKKDISYGYRYTNLKEKEYIIVGATLILKPGEKEKSISIMEDRKKRREESQPLNYPSAGSVFRNPQGTFAGKLIEDLNLKGYHIGGAKISEKHANFIINYDNAKSCDIIELVKYIKKEVKENYNIDLIQEQIIIKW